MFYSPLWRACKVDTLKDKRKWTQARNREADSTKMAALTTNTDNLPFEAPLVLVVKAMFIVFAVFIICADMYYKNHYAYYDKYFNGIVKSCSKSIFGNKQFVYIC